MGQPETFGAQLRQYEKRARQSVHSWPRKVPPASLQLDSCLELTLGCEIGWRVESRLVSLVAMVLSMGSTLGSAKAVMASLDHVAQ